MFLIPVDHEISLRLLMRKDARELFQLIHQSRDFLTEWLPWVDDVQSEEAYHQLLPKWLLEFAREESLNMGITYYQRLAGVSGFHYFDMQNRKTSIGYWLGYPYQGKGIMTRVVQKMLDIAFRQYGMNRVEIRCAVGNKRSRAIPIRLGFYEEGRLREAEKIRDRYVDHVVYSMTKSQWYRR